MREILEYVQTKVMIDGAAISAAVLGVVTDSIPTIALILSAIWTVIRIYEMETIQKLLGKKEVDNGEDTKSE